MRFAMIACKYSWDQGVAIMQLLNIPTGRQIYYAVDIEQGFLKIEVFMIPPQDEI